MWLGLSTIKAEHFVVGRSTPGGELLSSEKTTTTCRWNDTMASWRRDVTFPMDQSSGQIWNRKLIVVRCANESLVRRLHCLEQGKPQRFRGGQMLNTSVLRPIVTAYIAWRNPDMTRIAEQDKRWTPRQLYLDAKAERAQRKVLQMAVRRTDRGTHSTTSHQTEYKEIGAPVLQSNT